VNGAFVWLAASAGALSLVTPCVFPMVPITVSYFTQHGGATRAAAVRHAILFGVGIIATFTTLGLTLAIFVGATAVSLLAANPWVNIALAAIFVLFALNLFGVAPLSVPGAWLTALDRIQRDRGMRGRAWGGAGAALTGLTFTLTSFTCTAPFVGTVLVTAAQGNWRMPLVGMLVYSTVFALPFCVLALVPQWLSRLPRAGSWLDAIKVVMAFVELAAALKFLSNADLVWHWDVFTRQTVLASWAALAGVAAAYLLGWLPFSRIDRNRARSGRVLAAAGALGIAAWLTSGLAGRSLGELEPFLPPTGGPDAPGAADAPVVLPWRLDDYPGALRVARQENKRVFIDFTGYTCTNCRWMEANMFTRPAIKAVLSQFVLARLFTDGEGELYDRQQAFQQAQFHTVALPLYAVVDGYGHTVASLPGLTRDPSAFVAFLQRGLARSAH
jgi:thiol:disulfide interchange protein